MKTLGLIGGMSWESTLSYYRLINEAVRQRRGGLHSARLVLYSVDFHEIEVLQRLREAPLPALKAQPLPARGTPGHDGTP